MAISNRDRVGRGLEHLGKGLEPFVDMMMTMAHPGKDWLKLHEARDNVQGGGRKYSKSDVRFLLRVLTEDWRVFKDRLSRVESSYASELRDVGNKWGHLEPFSADDTYRALDTIERLLIAVGSTDQADEVRKIRLDHQRSQYDQETKKAASSISLPKVASAGIKPWRELITPHLDVQAGRLAAAEFAADLHTVATGESTSEEYARPIQFFRRTYLTEGLQDLLKKSVTRLAGDMNATPVWNLQTNFGGGKTHSMLALWHLFSGTPLHEFPQEIVDLLDGLNTSAVGAPVKRAALVGTHLEAGSGKKHEDGTHVNTIWGELAWQLGGAEAYEVVRDADESKTNPGAALRKVIAANTPCLILVDEWVAYARQLYGTDDLVGGTFDTQFTFAQTLTEVVKTVPGALLVVSIPASTHGEANDGIMGSALEIGAANGQAALARLQNVIRRVAEPWQPARPHEAFEIVKRRLFEEPDAKAKAEIAAVAKEFYKFYNSHKGEFPRECSETAYEKRIADAYPIHPELFDRLYEDWSTLDRFQRTRGVLRLMSLVIHKLWHGEDAGPLIMPGSIPLHDQEVVSELSQYLEDNWKAIISVDIDGEQATPLGIDKDRPIFGKRQLARRLARTLFFGATPTLKLSHKGIEQQNIWIGVAIPGDQPGNFGSALHQLTERSTYLYVDGARYWYDTQPSVGRTAKDYAERLHPEDVWLEIEKRLAKEKKPYARGDFAAVHVTDDSAEVPDTGEARLVIIHPKFSHARGDSSSTAMVFAKRVLDTRGSSQRINRNTVVFLAADAKRLDELEMAVRDYLAWEHIAGRKEELNLSAQQAKQVDTRLGGADQAVELRIRETYIWALVPDWARVDGEVTGGHITWQVEKADGAKDRLAERVTAKLRNAGAITTVLGASIIRQNLGKELASKWADGHIKVGDLWSYYCCYPYLQRVRDRVVFDEAVRAGIDEMDWENTGFALATGLDGKRYQGLTLGGSQGRFGQITDSTLVVRPDVASAQWEAEQQAKAATTGSSTPGGGAQSGSGGTAVGGTGTGGTTPTPPPGPKNVRYYGSATLDPETYQNSFNKLAQNIIQHLASAEGAELEITVEISARKADGFSEQKVRTVSENSRTLKVEFGFENS
jgi:hypothetical protein